MVQRVSCAVQYVLVCVTALHLCTRNTSGTKLLKPCKPMKRKQKQHIQGNENKDGSVQTFILLTHLCGKVLQSHFNYFDILCIQLKHSMSKFVRYQV